MKKRSWIFPILALSFLLTGCDLWMDGYYHTASPHMQQEQSREGENITASSYVELRNAVEQLVEDSAQKAVIYTTGIAQDNMGKYMEMALSYVKTNNPIGAYALEKAQYDIGTNAAIPAVAVEFTYRHQKSEIMRIKHTETMDEALEVIQSALNNCDAGVTVLVENFQDVDLTQMIQDYADFTPWMCMEMPQVSESVFPDHGPERLLELSFNYQTSRETLREMQDTVSTVFASAELYVRGGGGEMEKFNQLYSFLMERFDYQYESSITPAYSLLRHGVGDCKAFAAVYGAMCRQAGLECSMVSGTRNGEPWYWNMVCIDGAYYHVDLLQCSYIGGFVPRNKNEMGGYVWDYSAFPDNSPEISD